jgi:hypothetical protein
MSKLAKATLICTLACCGALLVIHRRVIAAYISGEDMPEPPEWHKEYFPCFAEDTEDEFEDIDDDFEDEF